MSKKRGLTEILLVLSFSFVIFTVLYQNQLSSAQTSAEQSSIGSGSQANHATGQDKPQNQRSNMKAEASPTSTKSSHSLSQASPATRQDKAQHQQSNMHKPEQSTTSSSKTIYRLVDDQSMNSTPNSDPNGPSNDNNKDFAPEDRSSNKNQKADQQSAISRT